jgi:predicted ATPase/class 3 adenylate cyclase
MSNPSIQHLPSGTVTFLFTDIEGSTKLAWEHRDQWERLRKRHHDILQSAIESHNGYVFQIIGDAFCAAFHTAGDALRAAAKSQMDLYNENWGDAPVKVRMGIHTGKAEIQENGEYHGYLAMSRIQRLMSAGHGGQVLISAATQELLLEDLPEDVSLRDLGERRLKDLIKPEHIYQLVIPGLPIDFPALKTLETYRHNLPMQRTSFIGREKEMKEIKQAILAHRLVTLTGSGGTGKTRLSLQVAADLLDQFPDGIWFVELAPISEPNLIPQVILSALGILEQPGVPVLQRLLDYLREKKVLLVLDNSEHLIEACAKLVDMFLNNTSALNIIATSREALGVQGELIWHVPSLSLPDAKHLPALEQLSQYEAVQLFIERATLVQPHFNVTNDNAPAVAQICFRLDGIPLAIELAAARVRSLSVDQIAKRLDDRFRLLTGGSRTALERQQTLRATIDWSYNLLSNNETLMLNRLSVFAGGWTLEAAEQVCAEENSSSSEDVLDLLTHLVEKSLVMMEESTGSARYGVLETTRQYALEKLIELGEDQTAHNHHFLYFLQLAEEAENQLIGPDQVQWLNRLEREHDNFRTALEWSIREHKDEEALRMAGALGLFWLKHSHFSEGRKWIGNILKSQQHFSEEAKLKALRWAGFMAFWQEDMAEASRIYSQNLESEQALKDQWGIAFSLHMLANIDFYIEGNVETARELHKRSIALSREINAIWVLALAEFSLGDIEHAQGNLALAEELTLDGLNHFRRLGEKFGMGVALSNLGYIKCSGGDFSSAKKIFLEALDLSREMGDNYGMTMILNGLAGVFQNEGIYIASAQLQGFVVSIQREIGVMLTQFPVEQKMFNLTANALKDSIGTRAYQKEFETGMALSLDDAVKLVSEQN